MQDVRYLVETLCWMGGTGIWSANTIAEQLGMEEDARFQRDLSRAVAAGVVEAQEDGFRLTDRGWTLAADDT